MNKPWFQGRRIVDLEELARQLNCTKCNSRLDLHRTNSERKVGLATVLRIVCECGATNDVFTDRLIEANGEELSFAINVLFPSDMLKCKLAAKHIISFLALLNIPASFDDFAGGSPLKISGTSRASSKSDAVLGLTSTVKNILKSTKWTRQRSRRVKRNLKCSEEKRTERTEKVTHSSKYDFHSQKERAEGGAGSKFILSPDAEDAIVSEATVVRDHGGHVEDEAEAMGKEKTGEARAVREHLGVMEDTEVFPQSRYQCPLCAKLLPSSRGLLIHLSRLHHRSDFIAEEHKVSSQDSGSYAISTMGTLNSKEGTIGNSALALGDSHLSELRVGEHFGATDKNMSENTPFLSHLSEVALLSASTAAGPDCISPEPGCKIEEVGDRIGVQWQCPRCCEVFKVFKVYHTHLRKCGMAGGPHNCSTRSGAFTVQTELEKHLLTPCPDRKQEFPCNVCDEVLPNAFRLKKHKHALHPKGSRRVYTCQECSAEFSHLCFLKTHMRKHTGERPFKCHFCSSTFISASSRNSHIQRHHSKTRPFLCETCGSGFYENRELLDHERIHTGEKPFACCHCSQVFARKSTLRVHKRQHTGEKPYQCEQCGAAFVQIVSLRTHKNRNHPYLNPNTNYNEDIPDAT